MKKACATNARQASVTESLTTRCRLPRNENFRHLSHPTIVLSGLPDLRRTRLETSPTMTFTSAQASEPPSHEVPGAKKSSSSSTTSRPRPTLPITSRSRPILILAARYIISQKEYSYIRRKLLVKTIASKLPTNKEVESVLSSSVWDDFLPASSRTAARMFALCNVVLNGSEYLTVRWRSRRDNSAPPALRSAFYNRSNFLSSLSLSTIIILHRLLYRFFHQLRVNLQLPQAQAFRDKYPKASRVFISRKSPALAASLSGLALAIHPATERRVTIAVYTLVKALEFTYNRLEDEGWFPNRPWWFGSWLLFPLASGQLLHSFIFDRDCFPDQYSRFITNYSHSYIPNRPTTYPSHLPWPDPNTIVSTLPQLADLNYPPFASPILFPKPQTLPKSLAGIAAVVAPAHPSINSLQCALLHPGDPSCFKTYLTHWTLELPRLAKILAALYTITWLPRYEKALASIGSAALSVVASTCRTSSFITGALGTSWGFLCLCQHYLPRRFFPRSRFFLAGIIGGLWAAVERKDGRAGFLYMFRVSVVSAWKVAKKKRWIRPVKAGDVLLFTLALALVNSIYEFDREAVNSVVGRKVLASLRGRGWRDLVTEKREKEKEKGPKTTTTTTTKSVKASKVE